MKQRCSPAPLELAVIRWHLALRTCQMLKATSLSLGHFCEFISCIPAGPPGYNSYDSGRSLFSKCCWLISAQQDPGLLMVQSLHTLAVGIQVPFPDGPLGRDIKWLKASCPSRVVHTTGPWGKFPPLKPFVFLA